MICDLELIRNIHILDGKEIVIWGAGNNGKKACRRITYMFREPVNNGCGLLFCDSDCEKWNTDLFGYGRVISPDDLLKLTNTKEVIILIASDFVNEIVLQMEKTELLKKAMVCTWFGLQTSVHFHYKDRMFSEQFKEDYLMEMHSQVEFLKAHYQFSKFQDEKNFFDIGNDKQAVYIIQPGKVGSTTLLSSLKSSGVPCVQLHLLTFLMESDPVEYRKLCRASFEKLKKKGMKIMAVIREPIARDISSFWQSIDPLKKLLYSNVTDPDFFSFFIKFIKEIYGSDEKSENIPYYVRNIHLGDQGKWFRETIYRPFGIDVFQYPFDKEKGYTIIQQGNIQMLIMQMEKINELKQIIGNFAGIENFELKNANEAKIRPSYSAYKQFLNHVNLPNEYIKQCYGDDSFVHHFYSKKDQKRFIERWEKPYSVI